jgi:hypothetical protein
MTTKKTQIFTQIGDAVAEMMRHERSELVECRTRAGRTIFVTVAPLDTSDDDEVLGMWDVDDDEIVDRKVRCRFRRAE